MASLIIVFIHIGSDAMLDKIPPFKLEPIPLNESAKNLPKFKWASNEIGTRHQLGGEPFFIQDKEKPYCKSCEKEMTFYAQLDSINDEYNIGDCGMIYIFICFDCYEIYSFIQSY